MPMGSFESSGLRTPLRERAPRFAIVDQGGGVQQESSHGDSMVTLAVRPQQVVRILGVIIGGLLVCYAVTQWYRLSTGHDYAYRVVPLFNLDAEQNVPTWYSSMSLSLCALILGMIGLGKRTVRDRFAAHWLALGGIFGFLSLDESAGIHEMMNGIFRVLLAGSDFLGGYLWYSWVIVGVPLVLFLGLAYLKFLIHLPAKTRILFVAAGALYVGGAVGMELIGSKHAYLLGDADLQYALMVALEETMEMTGIALFVYALLSYFSDSFSGVQILIRGKAVQPTQGPSADERHALSGELR